MRKPGLAIQILTALILGIAVGAWLPSVAHRVALLGQLFLAALKMIIAPVIMAAVMTGVARMAKMHDFKQIGFRTVIYYFATTATAVIIPMQCEYYALEGLTALINSIEKIKKYLNPQLKIEGLLRTMYDPRNNLAIQVSAQLLEHFGEQVYRTIIPRNVRLAEAPSHGLPIIKYDKSSRGALAYLALAGEMLRRENIAA